MGTSKYQGRAPARHASLRPMSKGTLAAAIYLAFQSMAFAQTAPQA